jgi:hypothetical protein
MFNVICLPRTPCVRHFVSSANVVGIDIVSCVAICIIALPFLRGIYVYVVYVCVVGNVMLIVRRARRAFSTKPVRISSKVNSNEDQNQTSTRQQPHERTTAPEQPIRYLQRPQRATIAFPKEFNLLFAIYRRRRTYNLNPTYPNLVCQPARRT